MSCAGGGGAASGGGSGDREGGGSSGGARGSTSGSPGSGLDLFLAAVDADGARVAHAAAVARELDALGDGPVALAAVFAAVDRDGSGGVTRLELTKALHDSLPP